MAAIGLEGGGRKPLSRAKTCPSLPTACNAIWLRLLHVCVLVCSRGERQID